MAYAIHYTTRSGSHRFRFLFEVENGLYQARVLDGPPYPSEGVDAGEDPPGCVRTQGGYRIYWFSLSQVRSLSQAMALAAAWAEDTGAFLQSGRWRVPYRTNDGQDEFVFSIERVQGSLRVYIEHSPSYQGRSEGSIETHRLPDGNRWFVCWLGHLDSWKDAEDLATLWAERTQVYIRTGQFEKEGSP